MLLLLIFHFRPYFKNLRSGRKQSSVPVRKPCKIGLVKFVFIEEVAITLARKESMVRPKIAIRKEKLIKAFKINLVHIWSKCVLNN